ncbi:MAG: glucose-1-phosphate adenylyltransferase subunit GlgD [Clostridia bacterium]|nr:glucose-1-phosphate adenylyltransferase subunit GlgD [Clostridia bacterium]
MKAAGLILSNIHDNNIPEMTAKRTMASLPFGGRYRLIDFPLSNMVNSGITKVGIVTHDNYRSLIDHIGTGKDWDLARRNGGIILLPPFITAFDSPRANKLYTTRLEALMGVMEFINHCSEDLIVLSDSDVVCNMDLRAVINQHEATGADVTVAVRENTMTDSDRKVTGSIVISDENGTIKEFVENTATAQGKCDVSMNIAVITRSFLVSLLNNSIAHGLKGFYSQALPFHKGQAVYKIYRYNGYCAEIGDLEKYFSANMQLLNESIRNELFANKDRPLLTKVRNTPPTQYGENAKVSNSLIADGCVIDGTVENCILFRGVHIKKGAVIRNSILLQDTWAGENVGLNCVISDKKVFIRDGVALYGHETMPFYIAKGKMI